jgi:hypothetical protein
MVAEMADKVQLATRPDMVLGAVAAEAPAVILVTVEAVLIAIMASTTARTETRVQVAEEVLAPLLGLIYLLRAVAAEV